MNCYLQCINWVSFPVRWSLSSWFHLLWPAADLISHIRVIIFGLWFSFDFLWVANTKFECIELYSAPDGTGIVNGKCNSGGNWQIQQCTYDSGICNIMLNLYHLFSTGWNYTQNLILTILVKLANLTNLSLRGICLLLQCLRAQLS